MFSFRWEFCCWCFHAHFKDATEDVQGAVSDNSLVRNGIKPTILRYSRGCDECVIYSKMNEILTNAIRVLVCTGLVMRIRGMWFIALANPWATSLWQPAPDDCSLLHFLFWTKWGCVVVLLQILSSSSGQFKSNWLGSKPFIMYEFDTTFPMAREIFGVECIHDNRQWMTWTWLRT